jgi:hypothetical protein
MFTRSVERILEEYSQAVEIKSARWEEIGTKTSHVTGRTPPEQALFTQNRK